MPDLSTDPYLVDLIGLALATAVGLLIGFEREAHADVDDGADRVGVRTLALIGLAGGLGGILARSMGGWALLVVAAPAVAFLLGDRWGRVSPSRGITTEFAGLVVLASGMVATTAVDGLEPQQRWTLVAAVAVLTLILLSTRSPLHRLATHISEADLYATGRLGVLLVIVLPLLPREPWGPIPGLVPFEVGLMVSLIMAIGFVAYVGVRARGPRQGLLMAGGLGGLASSTAVTLEFARRVRREPDVVDPAAAGIVLAAAAMVPRQLVEVAVVAPALLERAALPIGAMGAVALLGAWFMYRRGAGGGHAQGAADAVDNPSSLTSALKFGGVFVVVVALTELALAHYGETGLYLSALLGGLTDADAITLAVGRMWGEAAVAEDAAVLALVIGSGSNTLVKVAIGAALGGGALGRRLLMVLGPAVAVGVVLAAVV